MTHSVSPDFGSFSLQPSHCLAVGFLIIFVLNLTAEGWVSKLCVGTECPPVEVVGNNANGKGTKKQNPKEGRWSRKYPYSEKGKKVFCFCPPEVKKKLGVGSEPHTHSIN